MWNANGSYNGRNLKGFFLITVKNGRQVRQLNSSSSSFRVSRFNFYLRSKKTCRWTLSVRMHLPKGVSDVTRFTTIGCQLLNIANPKQCNYSAPLSA